MPDEAWSLLLATTFRLLIVEAERRLSFWGLTRHEICGLISAEVLVTNGQFVQSLIARINASVGYSFVSEDAFYLFLEEDAFQADVEPERIRRCLSRVVERLGNKRTTAHLRKASFKEGDLEEGVCQSLLSAASSGFVSDGLPRPLEWKSLPSLTQKLSGALNAFIVTLLAAVPEPQKATLLDVNGEVLNSARVSVLLAEPWILEAVSKATSQIVGLDIQREFLTDLYHDMGNLRRKPGKAELHALIVRHGGTIGRRTQPTIN